MLKYVIPGKRYINLKKGTGYQVFQFAMHTETTEGLIIYTIADDEGLRHKLGLLFLRWASSLIKTTIWARPIALFEEKFREDAEQRPGCAELPQKSRENEKIMDNLKVEIKKRCNRLSRSLCLVCYRCRNREGIWQYR